MSVEDDFFAGRSAPTAEENDTAAMFYRMSASRLRSRCLWAGALLLASILVPFEIIGGRGIFVWSVLAELDPAARIAALAPAAAGLALILLGLRTERREGLLAERPTSRAIAVLALFVAVNAAVWIGRRSSAWGLLPLPDSLTTRPAPFLLVLALTGAGSVLRFHPRARKAGSVMLLSSIAAALAFYLWPSRGEIPAQTIARALLLVATLPDFRFQIGYGMILLFITGPLVIALLGLAYVRGVPRREQPGLAIAAVWGVPGLMLLFVYRAFIGGGASAQAIVTAFFAFLLVAVVALLATSIEVIGLGVTLSSGELDLTPGVRPIAAASAAALGVAGFIAITLLLGRPASKGVDWKLGAPAPEWDKVYGELVPKWEGARLSRDRHARSEIGTGAEAQVATRGRARELVAAAAAQPGGKDISEAMKTLAAEVDDLELSGRAFGRLVADVNDAARKAELPYYLDPSIRIHTTEEATTRLFYVTPYRVKEVHGYRVGGDRFATLLVESMTGDAHVHLGFSRDKDPFALVVRSEISWYSERFEKGGETCGSAEEPPAGRPDRRPEIARCAAALAKVRERLGTGIEEALLAATERHELQHQIDGPHLPLSSAVAELMAGYADEAQDRANRELSAYLAEMTAPGAPPQLTLLHLFPFAITARGGAENRVALLLLESLSWRELRTGARGVDPAAYAQAFEEQITREDGALRDAARAAWKEHYGAPLAEPVRE